MNPDTVELYVGARAEIGFGKETERGVQVAPPTGGWQPHEGFDFKPMVEKLRDEAAVGHIAEVINAYLHRLSSEGSVPLRLTKDFIGHLCTMITGASPSSESIGGGKYRHTWNLANTNRHQTYTIQTYDPVRGYLAYPLAILVDCAFELNIGSMAKVTPNFYAGEEEAGEATSRTYPNTYEYPVFMPNTINCYIADDVAGLDVADPLDIEGVPFSVGKNAVKRFRLGKLGVADNINQRFGAGGTIEGAYASSILRTLAHTNVHKAMRIEFEDSDATLKFDFKRTSFEDWSRDPELAAYMKNSVAWFAELDTTEGLMTIVLENDIASY